MEVFTLILQKHIREDGKFRYHWGCKELEISHLCFANDLLVLCHGDANSVKVVKRAMDLFSSISGLNLNIVYWASVFILPKLVIKDINKLLKGFLWCHGELSKGKAKVAWKSVCMPKNEGVLGIKDLGQWNETLMAKHLWNIASMNQSLWVKWINVIRLKGYSIWEVKYEQKSSYGWKKILNGGFMNL
ncbi:hypothetical protein Tco_1189506 [Tanacetum coccineum]